MPNVVEHIFYLDFITNCISAGQTTVQEKVIGLYQQLIIVAIITEIEYLGNVRLK